MTACIPEGYSSVTAWIAGTDTAGLIEFLKQAFGARETARVTAPDGRIEHAEIRVYGAAILAFDQPAGWPPTPALIRLYVEDCDATFARAIRAGGAMVSGCKTLACGDRMGRIRDPFGNVWWLQTHVEDVGPEEVAVRERDPAMAEAADYLRETLVTALK